jgi:penicillin-binding protein 1B
MSKKAKKKVSRRKRSQRPRRRGVWSRLVRAGLFATGVVLGLLIPWVVYLDQQVKTEFEGRRWDLPSRVFARSLNLYPGLPLTAAVVRSELQASGYRVSSDTSKAGRYTVSGNKFDIHRRPFHFEDGKQPALHFTLTLAGGQVASIRDVTSGRQLDLVQLDPAEIASIWPLHDEDRTLVEIAAVPELLVTGLQAVEDRRFKHHNGVDLRGIMRAVVANVRARETVQGGSTLTQQLVKNYFLNSERTLLRKFNEAIMAWSLEWRYEKADILEAYLNEVYLGQQGSHGIHGFGRGSEFYFGQPLSQLENHQIALLVGLVKGASLYNPRRNPERALKRRNQVLGVFAETGLMSMDDANSAKARGLDVIGKPASGRNRYPAFIELVRRQLRRDYQESDLASEGLRILTTLAPSEQELAQAAVSGGLDDLAQRGLPSDLQGALVLADVSSGEVRALVGDRSPSATGFNRALDARRQIGSVIKPLVYLLALEHSGDYNLMTRVADEPVSLRQPDGSVWTPQNYDETSHGDVTLLEALTQSYNQATVHVGMRIGVQHLVRKLQQLGIQQEIQAVPATLLGAVELTPLEVTQIYQSLAAGGYSVPLRSVTTVQTPAGETLQRYPLRLLPLERRDAIAVLNYALTEVVTKGTARSLPGLLGQTVDIAGKTGTTNERRDSWFVGYTRDLVAVAWVGRDDNRPAGVTGSNAALRVWAKLFRDLPLQPVDLRMPDGAYWMSVDVDRNALSHETCAGATQMPFVAESEPESVTGCLKEIEKQAGKSGWRKWFDKKKR